MPHIVPLLTLSVRTIDSVEIDQEEKEKRSGDYLLASGV